MMYRMLCLYKKILIKEQLWNGFSSDGNKRHREKHHSTEICKTGGDGYNYVNKTRICRKLNVAHCFLQVQL